MNWRQRLNREALVSIGGDKVAEAFSELYWLSPARIGHYRRTFKGNRPPPPPESVWLSHIGDAIKKMGKTSIFSQPYKKFY